MNKYLTPLNIGLLALALVFVYLAMPKSAPAPANIGDFADCLTAKGAELYTTSTCPHCAKQKALFGDAVSKLKVYTCDIQDNDKCVSEGIEAVPTWKINGEKVIGEQSFEQLSNLSGCQLT